MSLQFDDWLATQVRDLIENCPRSSENYESGFLNMLMEEADVMVRQLPKFGKPDLATLKICVAARSRSTSAAGRGPRSRTIAVQVMLLRAIDKQGDELSSEENQIARLNSLNYGIDELLAAQSQLGWTSSSNEPIFDYQSAITEGIYRSVITANFTGIS